MTDSQSGLLPSAILLIAALTACGQGPSGDPPVPKETTAQDATPTPVSALVENVTWRLEELGGRPVHVAENHAQPDLLLRPADASASGTTGCNQFSGGYELRGDSLRFRQLISTLRACLDQDMNLQERTYLVALGATRTWQVAGDTLLLSGETGPLARFRAAR